MKSLRGFTLAEMAVVVLIMGITLSMGLKMVTANLDNSAYSETKSKQERIKLALIGYLRTNGRLPCPDTNLPPDGSEDRMGTSPNDTCSAAGRNFGAVPYVSLNLTRDAVLDGWGSYFTYKVATANDSSAYMLNLAPQRFRTANQNWTTTTVATNAFDISSLNTSATDTIRTIIIKGTGPDTNARDISYTAVAVIISHGKNGFGAATTKSALRMPATAAIGAGQDEISNATDTTLTTTPVIFIRRPVTEVTTAIGGAYDDIVAYMTPQDLLQPLISEGTLKTCVAYCSPVITSICSTDHDKTCTCPSGAGVTGTASGSNHCSSSDKCSTCQASPPQATCTTDINIPIGTVNATCP